MPLQGQLKNRNMVVTFRMWNGVTKIIRGDNLGNGLSMNATINKSGFPSKNELTLSIKNMVQADAEALTTLSFAPRTIQKNQVSVAAGYDDALTEVFFGDIYSGSEKIGGDSVFTCKAMTTYFVANENTTPITLPGRQSAASIFAVLAAKAGLVFLNINVSAYVTDPLLKGDVTQQIYDLAKMVNCSVIINNRTLTIANPGTPVTQTIIPINASTGMIDYPFIDENGIMIRTHFIPGLATGSRVVVTTDLGKANGLWYVYDLTYNLENMGDNFTQEIRASYIGGKLFV